MCFKRGREWGGEGRQHSDCLHHSPLAPTAPMRCPRYNQAWNLTGLPESRESWHGLALSLKIKVVLIPRLRSPHDSPPLPGQLPSAVEPQPEAPLKQMAPK